MKLCTITTILFDSEKNYPQNHTTFLMSGLKRSRQDLEEHLKLLLYLEAYRHRHTNADTVPVL